MDDIFPPAKTTQVKARCIHLLIFTNAKVSIYLGSVNTLPALLLAAAGVGVGHAVMPDHWLPLAVVSRTNRYRTGRVVRLSLAAAVTHVAVSLALGGILIVIGLQFRGTIARHADLAVGGILLATGVVFLALDLLGKGHHHDGQGHHHHDSTGHHHDGDEGHHHEHGRHGHTHDHGDHDHDRGQPHEHEHGHRPIAVLERPEPAPSTRTARGLAGLLIPFGAAASPDLTILPVFLAASALGVTAALGTLASFTAATIATIAGLTTATALGARLFTAQWIDRRANLITALTLIAIGALAAAGLI
jgi:nickel/cobalt transporter (NicO) family protein